MVAAGAGADGDAGRCPFFSGESRAGSWDAARGRFEGVADILGKEYGRLRERDGRCRAARCNAREPPCPSPLACTHPSDDNLTRRLFALALQ